MRTKQIRPIEPEIYRESSHTFIKEENGFYKKTSWESIRDGKTGKETKLEETIVEEFYEITAEDEHDYTMSIQDVDGGEILLKFKKVENLDL